MIYLLIITLAPTPIPSQIVEKITAKSTNFEKHLLTGHFLASDRVQQPILR